MVVELKGEERSQFLSKAKYDEVLRCLECWKELGSATQLREAYLQGYAWVRKYFIVNVKEGMLKKKAALEEIMVVSHRDRMFDDIHKSHIIGGHCKDRALHDDAVYEAHEASMISHKIQPGGLL
ncbi:MAG: hypothetical protein SGPRY_002982 [Prymnesium sp.]